MTLMTLQIDLPAELQERLPREAERRGKTLADYPLTVLERTVRQNGSPPHHEGLASFHRNLPRRSPADLVAMARERGVRPATRVEDLRGNVWPRDESVDEVVETVRKWRRGQA
jgi:hypothetical protein